MTRALAIFGVVTGYPTGEGSSSSARRLPSLFGGAEPSLRTAHPRFGSRCALPTGHSALVVIGAHVEGGTRLYRTLIVYLALNGRS